MTGAYKKYQLLAHHVNSFTMNELLYKFKVFMIDVLCGLWLNITCNKF